MRDAQPQKRTTFSDAPLLVNAKFLVVACFFAAIPITAAATPLTVESYSMNNGGAGSFSYQDTTYLPCPLSACTAIGGPVSGGTGGLTDGFESMVSWNAGNSHDGHEPWIGWSRFDLNGLDPVVTFFFSQTVTINAVTVWLDNTGGTGGVVAPGSILIDGMSYTPPQNVLGPQAFTVSGLNIVGSSVDMQFFQEDQWIMIGEVSFEQATADEVAVMATSTPVPEPATLTLTAIGLAAVCRRYRRGSR